MTPEEEKLAKKELISKTQLERISQMISETLIPLKAELLSNTRALIKDSEKRLLERIEKLEDKK